MTIRQFAADRGISYDRAYRAAKAVILAAGRSMNAGRFPTEMTADDVKNADEWRLTVGKRTPVSEGAARRHFEGLRRDWMEKWTSSIGDVASKNSETIFAILGLISAASGPEWFDRPWGVGRLGDTVLKIAMRTDVDWGGDECDVMAPWVGFTGWLIEQGYIHTK